MIDPETGKKVKTELRDIEPAHIAFADRPAIREGYAIVKNVVDEEIVGQPATEAPEVVAEDPQPTAVEVQKADEVVVTDPAVSPPVATPAHDALLGEKIAVLEKQIADLVTLLKTGGYSYVVWEKWWNAYDMLSALCPEAQVIAMAKTERDPSVSFEKSLDNTIAMLGSISEAKAAQPVTVLKTDMEAQVSARDAKIGEHEATIATLQKSLDEEKAKSAELQKSLDEIGNTASSKALPTERPTEVRKTASPWDNLKLY